MCLILFAYRSHPKYKLIVAANRDEFYERATLPAHFWEEHPYLLAGQDLEKMGTWMGVTTTSRFAALTNYRDPKEMNAVKQSRGEIVANFLKNNEQPNHFLNNLSVQRERYPGYNILVGTADELYYYSNIEDKPQKLSPGVYGVSNHLLNTSWPKVEKGKKGLEEILNENSPFLVEQLLTLLHSTDQAPDALLPNTGVSKDLERILSPMFIKSENYGTRSSTVLLMDDDQIHFTERVFTMGKLSDQEFSIDLN